MTKKEMEVLTNLVNEIKNVSKDVSEIKRETYENRRRIEALEEGKKNSNTSKNSEKSKKSATSKKSKKSPTPKDTRTWKEKRKDYGKQFTDEEKEAYFKDKEAKRNARNEAMIKHIAYINVTKSLNGYVPTSQWNKLYNAEIARLKNQQSK